MFIMPAWVVGATVVTVVIGTTVVTVVIGAAVSSVVTVGTGVGVTVAGLWVAHPANSTPAAIKTARIRKILFLSMTEFSTSCFYRNGLTLI
jgi:hypothetical protein